MRFLVAAALWAVVAAQYVPEPYGWACFRMAAKRNWPTCSSVSRTKQRQCLCQIPEFVSLTESCLLSAAVNATNPEAAKEKARNESLCMVIADDTPSKDVPPSLKKPSGKSDIPELEYVDPVSQEEIEIALLTAKWRMANDRKATRSGIVLVAYWGLILIVRYVASVVQCLLPQRALNYIMTRQIVKKVRARFFNSPLGRTRHCEPCLGFLGIRLPTRILSVILIIFVAVNYILIFTDFPYESANFIYTSPSQQYNKSLAIRAAFMIMWKLPLLVCFAGRNNIFLLLGHPWPLDAFNVLHKWIARITVIDIIIHSVAISLVKAEQGIYGAVWKVDYWQWGVVGTSITSIIAFQSMHWISRHFYDTFVAIHVVLGVVFLIAAWYHVYSLPYGTYHIVATCAIWVFDRALRVARIAMAGKVEADLKHHGVDVSMFTIKVPKLYGLLRKGHSSNSYVFLHVPRWYLFWQSHPFTVVRKGLPSYTQSETSATETAAFFKMSGMKKKVARVSTRQSRSSQLTQDQLDDKKEPLVTLCVKHRRGITKFISSLPEGPISVFLDGPYGYSHPLHLFSKVLLFAGGIGITPVLSYVKRVLELRPQGVELQVHWAVSELESMRWAIEELAGLFSRISLTIYATATENGSEVANDFDRQATFVFHRLKCDDVVRAEVAASNAAQSELCHPVEMDTATSTISSSVLEADRARAEKYQSLAIFSCGPDRLNDEVRVAACWAIEHADVYVDYYEESFSW